MTDGNEPVPIRITREEVQSAHVDDLLRRQMSMRGESGVTRDRRRAWYYQNWLVFMIAGSVGATAAWGLLEPSFDDEIYFQGPITAIDRSDSAAEQLSAGEQELKLHREILGSVTIRGETIYLLSGLREYRDGRVGRRVAISDLRAGEEIGAFVDYYGRESEHIALASFVVPHPAPQTAKDTARTLSQLNARSDAAGLLLFPLVAGLIGLCIGAVDGLICRLPRRALVCGGVGLLVGAVGGLFSYVLANLAYSPLHSLAERQMEGSGHFGGLAFATQLVGRSLAWGIAGVAMGLGQGIALRSSRLLLFGLLGGTLGGLFGGLLFDPIYFFLQSGDQPSAWLSRLIGFAVIGAGVGAMIGVVELLARDAWLRMTQGPLTGKEFFLFKDLMRIGASPKSDLYLFNDPQVANEHASIRTLGDEYEIEVHDATSPVMLNDRQVQKARLRHGDNITIGRTQFVFQRRRG